MCSDNVIVLLISRIEECSLWASKIFKFLKAWCRDGFDQFKAFQQEVVKSEAHPHHAVHKCRPSRCVHLLTARQEATLDLSLAFYHLVSQQ